MAHTQPLPFGLRYATFPDPATEVHLDWSAVGYDPVRQVATVTENGVTTPLTTSAGMSTYQTTSVSTSTGTSDGGSDSDDNHDSHSD